MTSPYGVLCTTVQGQIERLPWNTSHARIIDVHTIKVSFQILRKRTQTMATELSWKQREKCKSTILHFSNVLPRPNSGENTYSEIQPTQI